MSTPTQPSSPLRSFPFIAPIAAALCLSLGLGMAASVAARVSHNAVDPCALPSGIVLGPLSERDRSYAARHAIACQDYEHRRISPTDYRDRLRALDAPPPAPPPAAPPKIVWAEMVRDVSSQYGTTEWSAARVLGPPDVFPASGDNGHAWAPREADGGAAFIEVGFDQPRRLNAVEIYETHNPGAVNRVELLTADGRRQVVYQGHAAPTGMPALRRRVDFACTDDRIVAVRVTLDTSAVPGWNELDAIGAAPCE